MTMHEKDLITRTEAAEILRVSLRTLDALVERDGYHDRSRWAGAGCIFTANNWTSGSGINSDLRCLKETQRHNSQWRRNAGAGDREGLRVSRFDRLLSSPLLTGFVRWK
jgi:hypothetical protein